MLLWNAICRLFTTIA